MLSLDTDPVETVADINLGHVDWAMGRVRVANPVQEPVQGAAKLHGAWVARGGSVLVDAKEGEVHDESRAAIPLRNTTQRREAESGKVSDQVVREDSPEAFGTKVSHFVTDKLHVFLGGLVAAALHAGVEAVLAPIGGLDVDGCSFEAKVVEVAGSRVRKVANGGRDGRSADHGRDVVLPTSGRQQGNR